MTPRTQNGQSHCHSHPGLTDEGSERDVDMAISWRFSDALPGPTKQGEREDQATAPTVGTNTHRCSGVLRMISPPPWPSQRERLVSAIRLRAGVAAPRVSCLMMRSLSMTFESGNVRMRFPKRKPSRSAKIPGGRERLARSADGCDVC